MLSSNVCLSQQNLPAAGPDVKLNAQNPPINLSGVVDGSGQFPGSSAWVIGIFSRLPPSPTVMYAGPQGHHVNLVSKLIDKKKVREFNYKFLNFKYQIKI